MRNLLLALATLATASAPAAAAPRLTGEAELAKLTDGRVAGQPVDCIDLSRVRATTIVEGTALVYDTGRTVYVNRPRGGAHSLDKWNIMVLKPFNQRLCSVDVVQMLEPGGGFYKGSVFLGDFVPFTKPRTTN
jgi:hypothetical protein